MSDTVKTMILTFISYKVIKMKAFEYRLKECWQEMLKHQPFGWLRNIFTQRLFNIDTISYTTYNIRINNSILDGDDAFNSYTFVDGAPFGIKEEENE